MKQFIFWRFIFSVLFISVLLTTFPSKGRAAEKYVFDRMWPTLQQPWYFHNPSGIAIDPSGKVYVVDMFNHRIQKFTSDGQFISKWGGPGIGDGEFWYPEGIALDSTGNVYVADTGNHRIQNFTADGQFLTKWGGPGDGDGAFTSPAEIAIDKTGNIYVLDSGNHRIQKFDSEGNFLAKWGRQGSNDGEFQFSVESSWWFSSGDLVVDSEGYVFVVDQGNNRIQKFTSGGQFVTKWGAEGSGDGQFRLPTGIAIDRDGIVYVADTWNSRIQKFNSNGRFLFEWGRENAMFDGAVKIATDGKGGIYVSDESGQAIQKFTSNGQLIAKWSGKDMADGFFRNPSDIAIDRNRNIYVADYDNIRVQKFDADGGFIGSFSPSHFPTGITVDNDGNIYVTTEDRVEKYTQDWTLLTAWGGAGDDDGQFNAVEGVAIDANGNVYVADAYNHRIQKFDSDGRFITKWGSAGTGDGQFGRVDDGCPGPTDIAVDRSGRVYAVDPYNVRIQVFTSDGDFITKWDDYGWADGQLLEPWGIDSGGDGYVYVVEPGYHRIQKFTSDGVFVAKCGSFGDSPGQLNNPYAVAVGENNTIYVADTANQRIQRFKSIALESNNKAIVVAGGGPFPGNNLWDATQMCANFAYRTLTYQGFTKESIYYLSSDIDLDLDNNGVADDVDADATNANLGQAITTWAKDADSLVLYLADHGGGGTFRMSGAETLSALDLDAWLDTLQGAISGKVTVIYDACESGSFVSLLTAPSGKERVVVTSTSPGESAKFVTQGSVSFSNYFWTHIFNGVDVKDAFVLAKEALGTSFKDQTPLLDANGNGVGNETEDYTLTQNTYIGNGTVISGDAPTIGGVSPTQPISGTSTASLYAESVTDSDGIARVWAVIRSPDYSQGSSDNPVTGLPSIDLMPVGEDRYEATYNSFNIAGTYQIAIYARDRIGNTSIPKLTSVFVDNPLRRRAIIVAGGPQSDTLWPAIQNNAGLAYDALTFQGYANDDIYFMSPVTFTGGVDVSPTLSNIEHAITTWTGTDSQDVVLYLVGSGGDGTFKVNEIEDLSASDLDAWLDSLQSSIPGKATVIYDACRSGSFLPLLIPPAGKGRILISSASGSESAYYLSGGDISFSKFFWGQVANGANVRDAFLHGKDAIQYACKGQTPQMDDNGNGMGNEKSDGTLARRYTIGVGIMLAGDDPIIGSVSPAQTLSGDPSATLWAGNVTSTNVIDKVWAVITPPEYSSDPSSPVTDLPIATLRSVGGNRYEGTYSGFSSLGTYEVSIHATDQDGNVSVGKDTTVSQTLVLPPCPECGGDNVKISNREYGADTRYECTASESITLGDGVTIKQGATMIFRVEQD